LDPPVCAEILQIAGVWLAVTCRLCTLHPPSQALNLYAVTPKWAPPPGKLQQQLALSFLATFFSRHLPEQWETPTPGPNWDSGRLRLQTPGVKHIFKNKWNAHIQTETAFHAVCISSIHCLQYDITTTDVFWIALVLASFIMSLALGVKSLALRVKCVALVSNSLLDSSTAYWLFSAAGWANSITVEKLSVCVLTRVAQIIASTSGDLKSCMHRPTDERWLQTKNKMFSCRRETALQGALVLAKVEDRNWETIFYGYYRSIFNHGSSHFLRKYTQHNKSGRLLLKRSVCICLVCFYL